MLIDSTKNKPVFLLCSSKHFSQVLVALPFVLATTISLCSLKVDGDAVGSSIGRNLKFKEQVITKSSVMSSTLPRKDPYLLRLWSE